VEDLAGAVVTIASLARGLERVLPDMTLAQYRILTMIGSSPQRAGRLAERATMSKSALTGLLDGVTALAGCVVPTSKATAAASASN